jgi:hypothetical protein
MYTSAYRIHSIQIAGFFLPFKRRSIARNVPVVASKLRCFLLPEIQEAEMQQK